MHLNFLRSKLKNSTLWWSKPFLPQIQCPDSVRLDFLVVVGKILTTSNFFKNLKDRQKPRTLQETHCRCLIIKKRQNGSASLQPTFIQGYWWDYCITTDTKFQIMESRERKMRQSLSRTPRWKNITLHQDLTHEWWSSPNSWQFQQHLPQQFRKTCS